MNSSSRSEGIVAPICDACTNKASPSPIAQIRIVGPNRSINQSLGFFLESVLDAQCSWEQCLPQIANDGAILDHSVDPKTVYLLDCLDHDKEAILDQLLSHGTAALKIVLFNIDSGWKMDQMAHHKEIWGHFYQDDSTSVFLEGLRAILNGRKWLARTAQPVPTRAKRRVSASPEQALQALSPREKELLRLVAVGMSNIEIAAELVISLHTVKTHLYKIYKKIAVSNRLQAALWATAHYTEVVESGPAST